jgi:hypothetical protein
LKKSVTGLTNYGLDAKTRIARRVVDMGDLGSASATISGLDDDHL